MKRENKGFARQLLMRIGLVVVATAAYGAVLAAWRSPLMAVYVAVKLPVVFAAMAIAGSILLSLAFAYRPIEKAVAKGIAASPAGFNVWFVILVVVALQAITLVRPMLSPIGQNRSPEGKCFFVQHFMQTWAGPSK